MGQLVVSAASGTGSQSLGGAVRISEFDHLVITLADLATATGVAGLRRIHQQGWIAVGLTPGGGPFTGVVVLADARYIELESYALEYPNGDQPLVDTIYWDIKPGGVVLIEVDWP